MLNDAECRKCQCDKTTMAVGWTTAAIVVLILQQQPELQRRKKSLLRPTDRMQTSSFESGTSFAPLRKVEMEGRGWLTWAKKMQKNRS